MVNQGKLREQNEREVYKVWREQTMISKQCIDMNGGKYELYKTNATKWQSFTLGIKLDDFCKSFLFCFVYQFINELLFISLHT